MKATITIGELAREFHLNPKTIRFYEDLGLLSQPRRSGSGYRLYTEYEKERLRLVTRAKLLGLSLTEIKGLVDYAMDGRCDRLERQLLTLVETKLGGINERISGLVQMRKELTRYRRDLSQRVASRKPAGPVASGSCRCIGDDTAEIISSDTADLSPGPGEGVRERRPAMTDKTRKESKSAAPQSKCGCGCGSTSTRK